MFIDAHTHTQPSPTDKAEFDEWSGAEDRSRSGCLDELLDSMQRATISRTMIVPWLPAQQLVAAKVAGGMDRDAATAEVIERWRDLNRWAATSAREHPEQVSCLVGVDPALMPKATMADMVAEGVKNGAIGIKVAPMFVGLKPDDEEMEPLWELAGEHSVFVLSEAGAVMGLPGYEPWGHPNHFDEVLRSYPHLKVQLAHLGVGGEDEVARLTAKYENVYTDLSMRLGGAVPFPFDLDETVRHIRRIGVERVLFGTNYPLVDQTAYVDAFMKLGLNSEEVELIGYRNALDLFGEHAD